MYEFALTIHSLLRAALVVLLAIGLLRGLSGWLQKGAYGGGHRSIGRLTLITADLQLVAGLLLYAVWSPQTKNALRDFGAAMKDPELRRWAVEHPTMMIGAIVLVHVANTIVKRAATDGPKFRWTAICFGLALVLVMVGSSWPWTTPARQLVRF